MYITNLVNNICRTIEHVNADLVLTEALKNQYEGITDSEILDSAIFAARSLIETEPNYDNVAAQLLLTKIYNEEESTLEWAIEKGVKAGLLNKDLLLFDIKYLEGQIEYERNYTFTYLGLQTLYDRYFLHIDGRRIEEPQTFFMRVAMGLALNEPDKNARAAEFYHVMSKFDFLPSTPTLFNSGTMHSQLSSCYLTTVNDDLGDIFGSLKNNALLSKFSGGLGNDWTSVRSLGSHIAGTNGKSQGVIPFLKVANDTAVAVNQGGKRKGAVCAYLETWHLDIEEFLELRKNTGDDRRRTHDMNTANWVPDLFMERVHQDGQWTLFDPAECPELHELYGQAFEHQYIVREEMADDGHIKSFKRIKAKTLWRKMLTMLFETGHPWITFKDACNLRNPQKHVGVIHSSNLCTEITLNTSKDEIAVCNLGSINLAQHTGNNAIDREKLGRTVTTAMRMLDNVIDLNFYPVEEARTSNMKHRPVGLGIMGFQDALHQMSLPYGSRNAVHFAGESMQYIAYYAYNASSDLAAERGKYETYEGSSWSKGELTHDTVKYLHDDVNNICPFDNYYREEWDKLREKIKKNGMRNSNCLAIAPTATISNIAGVSASIEPTYKNIFVKSNLSGEFTVINRNLVNELKDRGLWDKEMIDELKRNDGSLETIERVPSTVKALYKTAFEIDPVWLIKAAAQRQLWIDQAQSLNLYVAGASGKKLDEIYRLAWKSGLKTTYYLRTLAASSGEKSTGVGGELNSVKINDSGA